MPFTEEQKRELAEIVKTGSTEAVKPLITKIEELEMKQKQLADKADPAPVFGPPDASKGQPAPGGSDDLNKLRMQLADERASRTSAEFVAGYGEKLPPDVLNLLQPIHRQLSLSEAKITLSDGKETAATTLVKNLADHLALRKDLLGEMEDLKLSDFGEPATVGGETKTSYKRGREAAESR